MQKKKTMARETTISGLLKALRKEVEEKVGSEPATVFAAGAHEIAAQIADREKGTEDFSFLGKQWAEIVVERAFRVKALQSPEVIQAANIARDIHGEKIFGADCMDRRTSPTLSFGHPPVGHVGGAHRTEGAKVQLNEEGKFAPFEPLRLKLRAALQGKNPEHTQLYDAHVGCAAQGRDVAEEAVLTGRPAPEDKGLLRNVFEKSRYARATAQEAGELVIPIVHSFDPHSGADFQFVDGKPVEVSVRSQDPEGRTGLTEQVMDELVAEGLIVSSRAMMDELLEKSSFKAIINTVEEKLGENIDLRSHFPNVMGAFWQSMETAWNAGDIRKQVERKIGEVAQTHGLALSDRELQMRTKLVLESVLQQTIMTKRGTAPWPYRVHDEQFVSLATSGNAGPFHIAAFHAGAEGDELPGAVQLMATVIRSTRPEDERAKPILALNVGTLREGAAPEAKVTQYAEVAARLKELEKDPKTGAMLAGGNLVVINGMQGPLKSIDEVLPVFKR